MVIPDSSLDKPRKMSSQLRIVRKQPGRRDTAVVK